MYDFQGLPYNLSLLFSQAEFSAFHSPGLAIIRRKQEPKIFGFKM